MRNAALVMCLLLGSCTPTYEPPVSSSEAEPDFSQARKLIEANCAGCPGATKEGLESAIAAMQKVLNVGYVDRNAALRLIARAYNELALVYTEPGSIEQGQAAGRRRAALEQLVAFVPNDPAVRFEYAMTMTDPEQRILALREVVAVHPAHEDTRFALATSLADRKGSEPEAANLLKDLVDSSSPERAATYAKRLHGLLLQLGRKAEAGQLARRFDLSGSQPR